MGEAEYDEWWDRYDSQITGVFQIGHDDTVPYYSETFLIPDGASEVYVVYMIYDEGDSFGSAYGKIDILHTTISEFEANKLVTKIDSDHEQYTIKFSDDFGREISINNRGAGYFESVRHVGYKRFRIFS